MKSDSIHESDLKRVTVVDKAGGTNSLSDFEKATRDKYSSLPTTRPRLERSAKKPNRDYSFTSGISTNSSEGHSEVRIGNVDACIVTWHPLTIFLLFSVVSQKSVPCRHWKEGSQCWLPVEVRQ